MGDDHDDRGPVVHGLVYLWITYLTWAIVANIVTVVVAGQVLHKSRKSYRMRGRRAMGDKACTFQAILHLALSDFLTSSVIWVGLVGTGGDLGRLTSFECDIYAFFLAISGSQGVLMVGMLGFVRYRALMLRGLEPKIVRRNAIAGWILSLVYSIATSFAEVTEVRPSRFYCFSALGRQTALSTLFSFLTAGLTIFPGLFILMFYMRAFRNIRKQEAKIGKSGKYSLPVARVGVTVVFVYWATVLPWSGMIVYRLAASPEHLMTPVQDAIITTCILISFGANPIIYVTLQPSFRGQLLECLPFFIRNFVSSSRSTTHSGKSSTEASKTNPSRLIVVPTEEFTESCTETAHTPSATPI